MPPTRASRRSNPEARIPWWLQAMYPELWRCPAARSQGLARYPGPLSIRTYFFSLFREAKRNGGTAAARVLAASKDTEKIRK
jgi:hypothetical protein